MKKPLYVIRDQKTQVFESPMAHQNHGTVIRWFTQCLHQVPVMQNNPQDFDLFEVGYFDETTGLISSSDTLNFVINGLSCLENEQVRLQNVQKTESTQVSDDASVFESAES